MQAAKEAGLKLTLSPDRSFLFIQPEQTPFMHSHRASLCMKARKEPGFFHPPTREALASLAHAMMHGCICVLTIMCVCEADSVSRQRRVMDGGEGRNLQSV